MWTGYVDNRKNIVPLATLVVQLATFVVAALVARAALAQARTARKRHEEQTTADRERRITESFAKAVEQLGNDKQLATRLGGIYTLERISESEREYWPIMETLTAFVRERAPWLPRPALGNPFVRLQVGSGGDEMKEPKEGADAPGAPVRPATDIQAVLTVLRRRDEAVWKQDKSQQRSLDLSAADLRGADLTGAHLEGAYLGKAHLNGAYLSTAHLDGAHLKGADLRGAHLDGVHLNNADLWDADLRGAEGLTQEQVNSAQCNEKTNLEGLGLTPPPKGRPKVIQGRRSLMN
jgi:Pentapeptide repeats (8 copies)